MTRSDYPAHWTALRLAVLARAGYRYGVDEREQTLWRRQGDVIGWLGTDTILLDPDAAYKSVQQFASSQQAPLAVSQRTLWTRLREAGWLVTQASQTQNTVVRHIGIKDARVIALKLPLYLSTNSSFSSRTPETTDTALYDNEIQRYCFPNWWSSSKTGGAP